MLTPDLRYEIMQHLDDQQDLENLQLAMGPLTDHQWKRLIEVKFGSEYLPPTYQEVYMALLAKQKQVKKVGNEILGIHLRYLAPDILTRLLNLLPSRFVSKFRELYSDQEEILSCFLSFDRQYLEFRHVMSITVKINSEIYEKLLWLLPWDYLQICKEWRYNPILDVIN